MPTSRVGIKASIHYFLFPILQQFFGSEISEAVRENTSGERSTSLLLIPPHQAWAAQSVPLMPVTRLVLLFHWTPHLPHHNSNSSV